MHLFTYAVGSILTLGTLTAAAAPKNLSRIQWVKCPSETPPGVDCGEIKVPLTYKNGSSIEPADNRTITLGFARLNSTGNSTRGPLFTNPGGPGVPASTLVGAGLFVPEIGFSKNVMRTYDIIGLDPRGIGSSQPVKCNPKIFNRRVPTLVNSTKTYEALKNQSRELGESCAKLTGPLINYLDTVHVAKDHEVLRRAMGAKQFDYFGLSYGSLLGSTYLNLFSKYVGRMALDGIVDHSQSEIGTLLTEAVTYETTLNKFFEWCNNNSSCPLHGDNPKEVFNGLVYNATQKPIPAPGCNGTCQPNVTGEDILYNTQTLLEFVNSTLGAGWYGLAGYLAQAAKGNATRLSTALATSETSNSLTGSPFTYLAIGCQDWKRSANASQDLQQRLEAVMPFAPQTKGVTQTFYYQSLCLDWPAPVTYPQQTFNLTMVEKAPKILLSNSVYDPACSIAWANGVREQLPTAVSIIRNGTGHTSHTILGKTREAIDSYLATGRLPKDGTIYQT
jgi:pimeloyl-ACP methyl ester carboxylesterase